MSESNTIRNTKDDEIDVIDLFRRIGRTLNRWGHATGKAFLITIVFLIKRWLPLGLSVIAGIGVTYFLKATSPSLYTSDLVFRNNLAVMDMLKMRDNSGTTTELISKINKLHTLCVENNSPALSNVLSIKPESAINISDMGAYWIIDQSKDGIPDYVDYKGNHSAYDTVNIRMQDRLDVRVKIKSPQDLNLIRDGITRFIENDSLFQQTNRLRLRQNTELLARLEGDILQLDSLQKIKYFEETKSRQPQGSGQMIFLQEQKTQLIYNETYTLYARKQFLEGERDVHRGIVTILSDFSLPAIRDNGTLFYAKKFIPLFFGFTLLVLILLANRKKIEEVFKKY